MRNNNETSKLTTRQKRQELCLYRTKLDGRHTTSPRKSSGTVELRGSTWNASNTTDTPIPARGRARVERCEGLTLLIRPDE